MKKILLILLVLGLIGGGGYVWYAQKGKKMIEYNSVAKQEELKKQEKTKKDIANFTALKTAMDKARQIDSDLDGLTDVEEKRYGTDLKKSDTDGDGIWDKDEIFVYKTNPLKTDTDGDGFSDGYEVTRGFNPLGPGRLK